MGKSKVKKAKKLSESTREMINLAGFESDIGVTTLDSWQLVFMQFQPFNVTVLGKDKMLENIKNLQTIFESTENVETLCLSSAQSYEKNKAYLKERANDPNIHPQVRQLCQLDIEFLDNISLSMSTSRSFYFVFRFRRMDKDLIQQKVTQYRAIIREHGFHAQIAKKQELQKALAIYWEQNTHLDQYPEFDGEQFILEANNA